MKPQDVYKIITIYLVLLGLAMMVLYFLTHVLLGLPLWYVRLVIGISATVIAAIIASVWIWAYRKHER